jgi:PKD domain
MRMRIALVTAAVSLALPAAASAHTFCVNKPCLFGASVSTVQGALNAASANPGPDVVRIGARAEPYEGPFTYDEYAFNPVQIIGDGVGATVLAATSHEPALRLAKGASKVSGVTLVAAPPGETQSQSAGLELDGADAENVEVRYTGQQSGAVGVLTKADADVRNLVVDMSAGLAVSAEDGPQGTTIRDATLSATYGVDASYGATATFRDVRISAKRRGAAAHHDGHLKLSNVLVNTVDENGPGTGVYAVTGGTVTANHLTVAHTGDPADSGGIVLQSASVALQNSIVHGYPLPIFRGGAPGETTDLSLRYTNVDLASSVLNQQTVPGTVALGPGISNEDPRFASRGDFHLRGDSPLIDGGEFTTLSDETDIEGLDRDHDGDGDQTGEVDLGAFEYQRSTPTAAFSAGPAAAGVPVPFDGSASTDPDPGDSQGFAYSWSFGDGGTASGIAPQHVYAAPGEYTGTLTITDPNGLSDDVSKTVSVTAAPATAAGGGGPAGDLVAPVISRLRALPRRGRVRFRLSEPARVTLRFASARTGKRVHVLRLDGRAGLNSVRLPGRRALRPGAYRLRVLARDAAGNLATPKRTRLQLLPRP